MVCSSVSWERCLLTPRVMGSDGVEGVNGALVGVRAQRKLVHLEMHQAGRRMDLVQTWAPPCTGLGTLGRPSGPPDSGFLAEHSSLNSVYFSMIDNTNGLSLSCQ